MDLWVSDGFLCLWKPRGGLTYIVIYRNSKSLICDIVDGGGRHFGATTKGSKLQHCKLPICRLERSTTVQRRAKDQRSENSLSKKRSWGCLTPLKIIERFAMLCDITERSTEASSSMILAAITSGLIKHVSYRSYAIFLSFFTNRVLQFEFERPPMQKTFSRLVAFWLLDRRCCRPLLTARPAMTEWNHYDDGNYLIESMVETVVYRRPLSIELTGNLVLVFVSVDRVSRGRHHRESCGTSSSSMTFVSSGDCRSFSCSCFIRCCNACI